MEITHAWVKYNDELIHLRKYNVNGVLSDLEDGTIFGIIASQYNIDLICPSILFEDGEIQYYLSTYDNVIAKKFDLKKNVFSSDEDRLLIFKKLNGNLAQELLSGEVFAVSSFESKDTDDIGNSDIGLEKFQQAIEKYKDNNIIIYSDIRLHENDESGIFVVDDEFKQLFSKEILPIKEDVIETLVSIKQQAKEKFDEEYLECIDTVHEIALTDNIIYDLEHSNSENKLKIK